MAKPDLSTPEKRLTYWNNMASELLVGRRIIAAEYFPDDEFGRVLGVSLDNNTTFFVMADDEGNGPGALHFKGVPCGLPTLH